MGVMYRVCDCKDWQQGMTQIDGFIILGLATRGYTYKGKQFVYCPWCGKQIRDVVNEGGPPETKVEVRTESISTDDNLQQQYTSTMDSLNVRKTKLRNERKKIVRRLAAGEG